MKKLKVLCLATALMILACFASRGQFWDSSTGLLQCPSAEMNRDGTFMITNNFMNKHSISDWYWGYHTFEYGFNVNLWSRLEIGYVCVILDGKRKPKPTERDMIMSNQDRHFNAKVLLIREGDFGVSWMPALAVGVSDPISAATSEDYFNPDVSGDSNGFFNRYYVVATKHFNTQIGNIGAHLGYQYNRRTDFPMNGPCAAIDWVPVWLNKPYFSLKTIAEYDSRTFNVGFVASFWQDRFEAMFELMAMKWVNFGVRYKLHLKS
jgi:hypothetical protein